MPQRLHQITRWLRADLGMPAFELVPASTDASFRRYFRVTFPEATHIVMDAPPQHEDIRPFTAVARVLHGIGVNVPQVLAEVPEAGFALLSDLGTTSYLDALDEESVERLYGDALGALAAMQVCAPVEGLPPYDRELLGRELALFTDWYLARHLRLTLSTAEEAMLARVFELLVENALAQPQVFVHRDYHSRNLMVAPHNPGILDFQDAVAGPITYDLASLLRDAYIEWPRERVDEWVMGYHDLALDSGLLRGRMEEQFMRWFDLMGAQRFFKVAGIFARLHHRDGKDGYLADIPRVLGYLREAAGRYPELAELGAFLDARVLSAGA